MTWRIANACEIESHGIDAVQLWELRFAQSAVLDVAVGLCLLLHDLVSAVELSDGTGSRLVRVSQARRPGSYPATVSWQKSGPVIALSPTELEMITVFCLKAIRDGVAEVDHIDVETDGSHPEEQGATFIFSFPKAIAPLTPDEARRRLGL